MTQEVEQEIALGRSTVEEREDASQRDIRRSRNDVLTGMFFSNLVMYFIILTSAATLHAHGKTTISTARAAAEALGPLAADGAYWLFSLGLIGAGMLGVPAIGRILRLRHRRSGRLGWLVGGTPTPRSRLLCCHRHCEWRSASAWITQVWTPLRCSSGQRCSTDHLHHHYSSLWCSSPAGPT
jgi:hypothetical protein